MAAPLARQAEELRSKGRGDDSMLIHMTPKEVGGLQALALASGGSLTINPDTGLYEAGWLGKLLPTLLGIAGAAFGLPTWAIGLGGLAGGTAATGDIGKGLMAGLGAMGGAGIGSAAGLGGAISNNAMGLAGSAVPSALPGAASSIGSGAGAGAVGTGVGGIAPTVGGVSLGGANGVNAAIGAAQTVPVGGQLAGSAANAAAGGAGQAGGFFSKYKNALQIPGAPGIVNKALPFAAGYAALAPLATPSESGLEEEEEDNTIPKYGPQILDPRSDPRYPQGEINYFRGPQRMAAGDEVTGGLGALRRSDMIPGGENQRQNGMMFPGGMNTGPGPAAMTLPPPSPQPQASVFPPPSASAPTPFSPPAQRTPTNVAPPTPQPQAPIFSPPTRGPEYFPPQAQGPSAPTPNPALSGPLAALPSFDTSPGPITADLKYPGGSPSELIRAGMAKKAEEQAQAGGESMYDFGRTPASPYAGLGNYGDLFGGTGGFGGSSGFGSPDGLSGRGGSFLRDVRNRTDLYAAGGEVQMEEGGFVMPARETAEFGNGSTEAGQAKLAQLGGIPITGEGDGTSDSIPASVDGSQEARLANGETYFPPEAVERLGGIEKLRELMNSATKSRGEAGRGEDHSIGGMV